jgi:hypothetical protein
VFGRPREARGNTREQDFSAGFQQYLPPKIIDLKIPESFSMRFTLKNKLFF